MSDPVEMQVIQNAQSLPEHRRGEYMMAYQSQKKSRTTALLLSLFFGGFGVDRFYLGQPALGVLKMVTCGGGLIWTIIDRFIIMGSTDTMNRGVVQRPLGSRAYRFPASCT